MNDKSSRSHTMLIINFEVRSKKHSCKTIKLLRINYFLKEKIFHSKLNLIDLAGSENV